MEVPVKRYQRHQRLGDPESPLLYYLRQEPGSFKTHTLESLAKDIETIGALSVEDVIHGFKGMVRRMRKVLAVGDKVKIEGLGTFHITLRSEGKPTEKESTVKCIKAVNIRFCVDNTLRLANDSTATTRGGDNNVKFFIRGESDGSSSGTGTGDGDGGDGGDGGGYVDPVG